MSSKILEVDKPLYEYIKAAAPVDLDQAKKYNAKVLGYTANQFTVSIGRLIKQDYIMLDKGRYMPTKRFKHNKMVIFPCLSKEFLDIWDEYLEHRRDLKKQYTSIASEQKQLNFYWKKAGMNEQLFIAGARMAIDKNWIGIDYGIREVLDQDARQASTSSASRPAAHDTDEYFATQ